MARLVGAQKARGEGVAASRVPQIMQMESVECGAACLAMVCAYYDKWLPLAEVRRACGVGRDGAKAGNIARAAQKLGFTVHAYRFEPDRLREKATFPCIVHWNAYHFVVVRGFRGSKVLVNDPARGQYVFSAQEFDASFTGICICLQPGAGFQVEGRRPSLARFAARNLASAKEALAFVAFTTLIAAVVGLMNPVFSQVFVTRLLEQQNLQLVVPFMAVLVGVCAVQVIASALSDVYLRKIQGKLDVAAASGFFWKLLHLPLGFFAQRSVGDISSRLATTARLSQNLVSLLAPLVVNAGMLVVYLAIMIGYSPLLAGIGFAATAVNIAAASLVTNKRVEISRVQARDMANVSAATLAGMQTIETIKASGAENGFFRQWAVYQAQANQQKVRGQNLAAVLGVVPAAASAVANAFVLVVGLLLVLEGEFTVGMVLAFQGYLAQFAAPAQQMVDSLAAFAQMRVDMERIDDVMGAEDDVPLAVDAGDGARAGAPAATSAGEGAQVGVCVEAGLRAEVVAGAKASAPAEAAARAALPDEPAGRVELAGVTFGYNVQDKPLIAGFDLVVEPGTSVALVGASGSGKSTVGNLVAGLSQPWSGAVAIDGVRLQDIPRDVLTSMLSVVSQQASVFADTVANNIRLWDASISNAQVERAARAAAIHDDIMRMEGGYQHVLAEGGRNLSGGQRQRIEIARALAREPKVLVMDEATSALDSKTESVVMDNIRQRGITLVIVAHRLSTVRACDQIVVLDNGAVIERGTHDELMAAAGAYADLVRQG